MDTIEIKKPIFEKIDDLTLKSSCSLHDLIAEIRYAVDYFDGVVEDEKIDAGEIKASFKYGLNPTGIKVNFSLNKLEDFTYLKINGFFAHTEDFGPAKTKAINLTRLLAGETPGPSHSLAAGMAIIAAHEWNKRTKSGKVKMALGMGFLFVSIFYAFVFEPIYDVTLKWTNPALYKCIESANRSHAWAQAMHAEALRRVDSNGKPDPNIDPIYIFNPAGEIKQCHSKYD